MTAENPEEPGRVPVSDLRALVEEWREFEADREGSPWLTHAAKDLEELVAEYE